MKKLKTYVITVSEKFPKTHPKKGEPTNFPLSIKHYDKVHTIRGNYPLWKKRFEQIDKGEAILSVRIWTGKPYQSKQAEIFKYDKTRGIGLEIVNHLDDLGFACIAKESSYHYTRTPTSELAKNDGLSLEDFKDWFGHNDLNNKQRVIIHFTDFRYCD